MIPIFMLCVRKEHVNYYMGALILAMTISVMISYGIWLELIPPINRATINNPVPFGTHITYNVLLTMAIYLLARSLLFDARTAMIRQGLSLFVLAIMVANMFMTGGRSGQVMFFAAIVVLCFQYFRGRFFKAGAATVVITLSILAAWPTHSVIFSSNGYCWEPSAVRIIPLRTRLAYVASRAENLFRPSAYWCRNGRFAR